jgi:hypothetical protein
VATEEKLVERGAPWGALGADVAARLRPDTEVLGREILRAVVAAVPPLPEWRQERDTVQRAVREGLQGFLEIVARGVGGDLPGRDVYFDFGRSEQRAGRTVDAIVTAYRAAAQAAWRGLAETAERAGLPPRTTYALAAALFAYADDISAVTADGFAYEQSLRAEEDQDLRRRLVEAVVAPTGSGPAAEQLALAAGWRVPPRLAVLAFGEERTVRVAARLPADALVARVDGVGHAIVPDPDAPGRAGALRRGLDGLHAGLGPAVARDRAPESARLARLALSLSRDADGVRLVVADERRLDLLLLQDPVLSGGLVAGVLGPLDVLGPAARERALQTLDAWLEHQGEVRPAAADLHVHVQTVRYRVAQLRELLGDCMATPEGRLQLELALRARRLGLSSS